MFRRTSSSWSRIGDRIAPDTDDADDLAVEAEREILPEDIGCSERWSDRLALGCPHDPGDGAVADQGSREVGRGVGHHPAGTWLARRDDATIGLAYLDLQDLARLDQGIQPPVEVG